MTVPPIAAAAENSMLQCAASVPMYRVTTDGKLLQYQHLEPENGTSSWAANPSHIGNGWHTLRAVAAPGGVFYATRSTGELLRYRRVNNAWETYAGGVQYLVIDTTGWERYLTAEYKNRITVDAENHIYTVEPDGALHWRAYDLATNTWRHRVIAGGWGQYNLITAAGRGVLYARLPNGDLHRYRYHATSNRWVGAKQDIGRAWSRFDRVFSAGGDILYGVEPDGELYWGRWNEDSDTWTTHTVQLVGSGWLDWTTTALPDACQRVGTSVPTRPVVPAQPNNAVALLNASDGHIHYGYVDAEGRAVHGDLADLTGGSQFSVKVVPGLTGVTATPAIGEFLDGRMVLIATGADADVRESLLGANDVWTSPTNEGGFVVTAPTTVRMTGDILATFALDANYGLWTRRQAAVNTPLGAWQSAGTTPLAHGRLTVVPTSAGVRIIGLGRDGRFQTATYENGTLSGWTSLGGSGFTGTASAVVMPDGTVQVFATDSTGTVQTQRQTATGFPGTWTALPGITAIGSPSAIMSPAGTLQVVVKGPGNYAYFAGQTAPGSSGYTAWRTVTTSEEATTDPTALAVPGENAWVVGYVNELGEPKLVRYQNPVARSTQPEFVEVPIRTGT